jgi:very-short-patch-repair endonuclease
MSKFHLYCSCIVCHQMITVQNLNRHQLSHTQKTFKNSCLQCGTDTNTKFCSRSCSATYNNTNAPETRKFGPAKTLIKAPRKLKFKECVICFNIHTRSGKTCSTKCQRTLQSNTTKSLISQGSFDPKKNRGRGRKSFLEKSFESWLLAHGVSFKPEHPFKRLDTVKTYFADFYFPDLKLIIELDGTQHKHTIEYDSDRDNYIQTTYGVKIIRVTHKEYVSKSRLIEIEQLLSIPTPR